jgi:thioredoxin reductase (NADPH)
MYFESDLLIVGAGPVGLFAAFQAGMLKIDSIIVDSLSIVGGQCAMLYPEKPIYDIPAYPVITGLELTKKLQEQIKPFNQKIILNQKVLEVEQIEDTKYLVKTQNSQFKVQSIIFATGGGNFTPNRPPLPNIESFENKSIFYSINNIEIFRNKSVVIAGGGDSAIDWAINLAPITKTLYIVHRRNKFRAMQNSLDKLYKLVSDVKVELVIPYQLYGISGLNGMLSQVIVHSLDNDIKTLQCDYLLPFFGIAMNHYEMPNWGLELTNDNRYIRVDHSSMETNLSGIFAVGDIIDYPGKLKFILTGFAEATLAVHSAFSKIYPDLALHFEHSTSKGIPII